LFVRWPKSRGSNLLRATARKRITLRTSESPIKKEFFSGVRDSAVASQPCPIGVT